MSANPAQPINQTSAPRAADYLERRSSTRQPLGAVGVLAEESDLQFRNQLQVLVLNVSVGGVGFRSPVAFRPGATYAMRIGTGPLHLKARLQIISSRPREDGTFDVGAKFA
jgi:hypothetical protein